MDSQKKKDVENRGFQIAAKTYLEHLSKKDPPKAFDV